MKIYSDDVIRKYSGTLVVSNGNVNVSYEELTSVANFTTDDKSIVEEPHLSMTDEEYDKIYKDLDIPSFIDESNTKKLKHIQRLEQYDKSYNIVGYRNLDDTNTVYLFSSPIKYKDSNGLLRDAEPNIFTEDEKDKENGYSYVSTYGKLKTYFLKSLSNNTGIKIKNDNTEFEFGFFIKEENQIGFKKMTSAVSKLLSKTDKSD